MNLLEVELFSDLKKQFKAKLLAGAESSLSQIMSAFEANEFTGWYR